MNYVTSKEIKQQLQISGVTLMQWKNSGKIQYKKLSDKKILYDLDSLNATIENSTNLNTKNVIYARVSSNGQKEDLNNQIEIIKNYMLNNGIKVDDIYYDIASGMNENRKSFNELLEQIFKREIKNVYITFKDRLSRFGFNYFKSIFNYFGTNIIILDNQEETNKTYQQELTEDLIAIIHSYSMKLYVNRKKKLKEIEKILNDKNFSEENK